MLRRNGRHTYEVTLEEAIFAIKRGKEPVSSRKMAKAKKQECVGEENAGKALVLIARQ
jgi:hypothetical protein